MFQVILMSRDTGQRDRRWISANRIALIVCMHASRICLHTCIASYWSCVHTLFTNFFDNASHEREPVSYVCV